MLNGRCPSDLKGLSTFKVGSGDKIHTVIDYVLSNKNFGVDMRILNDFNVTGGHSAILVTCDAV